MRTRAYGAGMTYPARALQPSLPPPRPADAPIGPGDQVRALRGRPPCYGETGIVIRRRWWRRVDVQWTTLDVTTVRTSTLSKIPQQGPRQHTFVQAPAGTEPPKDRRWFHHPPCGGLFIGGPVTEQTTLDEGRAYTRHNAACSKGHE